MDLNQLIENVTLTKACTVKADKDSTESKTINLKVKFDNAALLDVFNKAMSTVVVQWQNGPGRKKFTSWNNHQTVEIEFKAPGRTNIDPEQAMIQQLKTMTAEEREAKIIELMKLAS